MRFITRISSFEAISIFETSSAFTRRTWKSINSSPLWGWRSYQAWRLLRMGSVVPKDSSTIKKMEWSRVSGLKWVSGDLICTQRSKRASGSLIWRYPYISSFEACMKFEAWNHLLYLSKYSFHSEAVEPVNFPGSNSLLDLGCLGRFSAGASCAAGGSGTFRRDMARINAFRASSAVFLYDSTDCSILYAWLSV